MAQPAIERGRVTPDQPANPARRRFLVRTGEAVIAAGAASTVASTMTNLWFPLEAKAAFQRPEQAASLTEEARIAEANIQLSEMRERRMRPHRIETATPSDIPPFEEKFPNGFAPAARIDRGYAKKDANGKKRYYVVGHDGWWKQRLLEYAQTAKNQNIPWSAFLVQPAYVVYPDALLAIKALGARFDGNHGTKHEPLSGKPYGDVIDDFEDQATTHNKLFTKNGIQLPEQPYIALPYFDGAIPGESTTDPEIRNGAKNLRKGIVGATVDSLVWVEGMTVDDIASQVLDNIVSGAIIVTHPDENGKEAAAMRIWAPELRRRGYAPHPLSELKRTKAVDGA